MTWIKDQMVKCIPLRTMTITTKATCLFSVWKEEFGLYYDVEFTANS